MSGTRFESRPASLGTHQNEVSHCAACPKLCRHTCPVADAEKRETVTPWGLMSALYFEAHGQPALKGSDGGLAWHCTSCRACQGACKFDNDVPGAMHAERAVVFARGDAPEQAKRIVERFNAHGGNLYSTDLGAVVREAVPEEQLHTDAKDLIWIDCVTAARYPDVIRDIATVVSALGLEDVGFYVDEVACCGLPLYDAGDVEGFAIHARKVRAALGGRRRILGASPGCVQLLRDVYPTVGVHWDAEIAPLIDLISPHLDKLPALKQAGPATVYHHPCHLARPLDRVSEPVAMIERATGQAPREPFRTGDETFCSGGGGGLPLVLPQVASAVATGCASRLDPRPGEVVVTACPSSRRRLEKVVTNPVVDLISLLAASLR